MLGRAVVRAGSRVCTASRIKKKSMADVLHCWEHAKEQQVFSYTAECDFVWLLSGLGYVSVLFQSLMTL